MKSLKDHIGSDWVKWILFIVFSITMAFNTYIVNKVDAIQFDYVRKEDYVREAEEIKTGIKSLNNKMDALLIHNSIKIPSQVAVKQ